MKAAGAIVPAPHAKPAQEVLAALRATPRGLPEREARERLRHYGPNRLREARQRSAWRILADQFRSLLVALLAGAAALSLAFGSWPEAAAIGVVLVINAAIGFASELRAARSMEALRRLGSVRSKVRRDGALRVVDAVAIVPGDVVVVEGGDVLTADVRLFEASKLQADESMLTGESAPVAKETAPVGEDAVLAERRNMLFKGTAVTRGAGEGVVVGTGMATELGRISRLVEEAHDEATPLEKRLDQLGHRLVWLTLVVAALVVASGIAAGREWLLVLQTGIALAVATVPEGLPIIATLALARGMRRMARHNALVNRLSAVETLGATSVIFTDKTGTLTENRMTVTEIALPAGTVHVTGEGLEAEGTFQLGGAEVRAAEHALLRRALALGVLCNDAALGESDAVGDPLEVALLVAGRKAGIERRRLLDDAPEEQEVAFDPDLKMMATLHRTKDGGLLAVKGAPEPVLAAATRVATEGGARPLADAERRAWAERNEEMARRGLRVIALAERAFEPSEGEEPYASLTFVGLAGLLDPPRDDVRDAIAACRRAGIRIVMVTGDQPATARTIALAVGLVDDDGAEVVHGADLAAAGEAERERMLEAPIFARISPEQKLDLIAAQQRRGAIVAMTGDGVNDAPALKKADIGVAMGQRGTEVARQASDIVLQDDAFATIVGAIAQGRVIFANIRSFVVYLLSCNISEIGIVGLASVANAPLPLLPLQILFLNLVTDVFPALALGAGEGDPTVMDGPPRDPRERVLEARHWRAVARSGALITLAVLAALALALNVLELSTREAVTISFLTLAFAQLWHVFDMRDPHSHLLRNEVTRNPWIWGALALCSGLILAAVFVEPLAALLDVAPPPPAGWLVVAATSVAPVVAGQAWSLLRRARRVPPTALLALALLAGCGEDDRDLFLVGTVERTLVEMVAPVSETIEEVGVERGQHVEPGALLVRLDSLLAGAELASAEAELARAQAAHTVADHDHARARELHRDRVASEQQLERARLALDEAAAAWRAAAARTAAARKHVADRTLRAPVAGVVDQIPFDPGERVPAGAVLAVLLADGAPWVRVWIPERAVALVGPGSAASVHVDGLGPLTGRILDVSREASYTPHYALTERERVHLVYEARVEIAGAPASLRPGVPAEVRIALPPPPAPAP